MNRSVKIGLAALAAFMLVPLVTGAGNPVNNALATLSYLGQSGLPRGIRNNNPGKIRKSANNWQGKLKNRPLIHF